MTSTASRANEFSTSPAHVLAPRIRLRTVELQAKGEWLDAQAENHELPLSRPSGVCPTDTRITARKEKKKRKAYVRCFKIRTKFALAGEKMAAKLSASPEFRTSQTKGDESAGNIPNMGHVSCSPGHVVTFL